MRLCYILLSPTPGMHQYTADLANRMAAAGHEVHLVTTRRVPRDRYASPVAIHTPVDTRDRGFSPRGWWTAPAVTHRSLHAVRDLAPDVVHITGAYLVNPLLLRALRGAGIPTVHTLHDLHPHAGAGYGRLLHLWNARVRREADHLLVHGRRTYDELVAPSPESGPGAVPPTARPQPAAARVREALAIVATSSRVTCTPLTHLFVGYERRRALEQALPDVRYEPFALFIGRLEEYKGLDVLAAAARILAGGGARVVIAGAGDLRRYVRGPLPPNVELRSGLIGDEEAVELFRRCGLLVLPYIEASQSALPAAAYFFGKPVVVTRAGALPEAVLEGETGWVVPPGDAPALAETLAAALADPQRLAAMGRAGRAWYERRRRAETAALQALYARLGAAAPGAPGQD